MYTIRQAHPHDKKKIAAFLKQQGLEYDTNLNKSYFIEIDDKIIATASISENVIKCMAVDTAYQGEGLSAKLLTRLEQEADERGIEHLFLFTKPENRDRFLSLGYSEVISTGDVILMEKPRRHLEHYLKTLEERYREIPGKRGSIVMNANPFTLGHRYLVETALEQCDHLFIFALKEERSAFPSEIRYRLIQKGCEDLDRVSVIAGSSYVISSATFPDYFLNPDQKRDSIHAELDLRIFGTHIAPALKISSRYAGTEPYCTTTRAYNRAMETLLPGMGIEMSFIPRKEQEGKAISASKVRQLLRGDRDPDKLAALVPKTSLDFLLSDEAEAIIQRLRERPQDRH